MVQGGDFTKNNGTGGESIYGAEFADESFALRHTQRGLLSMANCGANTNNSQFFITLRDTPHLDGRHVVFGRLVSGFDVLERIAACPTDAEDKPITRIQITNCGEIRLMDEAEEREIEEKKAAEETRKRKSAAETATEEAEKAKEAAKVSVESVQKGVELALKKPRTEAPKAASAAAGKVLNNLYGLSDSDTGSEA